MFSQTEIKVPVNLYVHENVSLQGCAETDRHSHDLLVRVFKPCKRLAAPEGMQSIKCVGGSVYFLSHTRRAAIINENKSFDQSCVQNSKMALHEGYVS